MASDGSNDGIVYVIDDDESARHSLEFLLDVAGVRVRSFASADAFLKAGPPLAGSCVVTDVRMPGMSGIELAEELQRRANVPVIVITGHADVPLAIQAEAWSVTTGAGPWPSTACRIAKKACRRLFRACSSLCSGHKRPASLARATGLPPARASMASRTRCLREGMAMLSPVGASN